MPLILTPLRFRGFRLWSAANLISNTGAWMRVLAANWLLLVATGSAAQMGFGILMYAVPVLLLGPWAGAVADRLPAKPLITLTQLSYAGLALILMAVALPAVNPVPWVYGAMLVSGVLAAVEGPSLSRFGSTLIDQDHLGPALAVGSLISSGGRIVGMSLGGLLAAVIGPGPLFLFSAASTAAVIGAIYAVRPLPVATGPRSREVEQAAGKVWGGLRYLLRDPLVLLTLGLAFLLGSVGRNYQVTMAAMTAGPLAGGAGSYGLLSTVFAVGATVGGAFAARAGRMYGKHLVFLGLGMGLLEALSGLAPGLWWFAAAILPIAAIAVIADTVVMTRLQLDNPIELRGRVLAAIGATGAVAGAVGAPMLGWLSDLAGPRATLELAGLVTAVGCAAAAAGYASVRRRRATAAQAVTWTVALPSQRIERAIPAPRPATDNLPARRLTTDALPARRLTTDGRPTRRRVAGHPLTPRLVSARPAGTLAPAPVRPPARSRPATSVRSSAPPRAQAARLATERIRVPLPTAVAQPA